MKRIKLYILFLLMVSFCYSQNNSHSFKIENGQFLYDGKPMQIHAGEMHYPRVPRQYWRHRLQMIKAMGLNTVTIYTFWNYHNTAPGVWDFQTANRDIAQNIREAQEEGLFVILRPGPYVCAEWEFGGFPWWLQTNKQLVVRTNNQPFLDSCKVYINKLAEQVRNLQVTHGGPILMIQVENEFGSYVEQRKDIPKEQHRQYKLAIKQILKDAGFDVPMFTSDGSWLFDNGAIEGVLPTANGENDVNNLKKTVDKYYSGGPYMIGEFYPGWLDHWGDPFIKVPSKNVVDQTKKYLDNKVNFNFYMIHGGTNFGFTSGANYSEENPIQPDITSYDYDAPISEAGWATPKFEALREVFQKEADRPLPDLPKQIPVITMQPIKLVQSVNLFEWMQSIQPIVSNQPLTFEELGQGSGYVVYCRKFAEATKGKLKIDGLRDYALVYVNDKKIGELNRMYKHYDLDVVIPAKGTLRILVENMGRINYGSEIVNNTKGIISPIKLNDKELVGNWKMYKLPMENVPKLGAKQSAKNTLPAIYKASFRVKQAGDTFLDMSGWEKGIVFVNGIHLGRYWKIGPQQTLYLPGCWLHKGKNEIVVFEQQNDTIYSPTIKTVDKPILEKLTDK